MARNIDIEPAITVTDLSYAIGRRKILDAISIEFAGGKIIGVLGTNGAGKSTLLSIILGLKSPTSGSVKFFDTGEMPGSNSVKRRLGAVLQEISLYDELSAEENLAFAASLYGIAAVNSRIAEVLEIIGLTERRRDRVSTLSGGMRRRLTIARALLHKPDILVVDEPTLGVDAEARHTIWAHLRELRLTGVTVVVATNYLDEALALCDTTVVLRDGRLVANETPEALAARVGNCLELEYAPANEEAVIRIANELAIRFERTATGISMHLKDRAPDDVIRRLLDKTELTAFRIRPADLAEIFTSLNENPVEQLIH